MQTVVALAALGLTSGAAAKEPSVIVPRVEAGGVVSWTAMIEAATVRTFAQAGGPGREDQPARALGLWLDEHLAAVSWCRQGWRYRTENPRYVEELADGRLRVLGMCHAAHR